MLNSTEKTIIRDDQYIEITKEIPSGSFKWEIEMKVNGDQGVRMLDNGSEIVMCIHTNKTANTLGKMKSYNMYDLENELSDEELICLVRQFSIIITDNDGNVTGAMLRHQYKKEAEE